MPFDCNFWVIFLWHGTKSLGIFIPTLSTGFHVNLKYIFETFRSCYVVCCLKCQQENSKKKKPKNGVNCILFFCVLLMKLSIHVLVKILNIFLPHTVYFFLYGASSFSSFPNVLQVNLSDFYIISKLSCCYTVSSRFLYLFANVEKKGILTLGIRG